MPLIARPALQDLLKVESDQQLGVWMGWLTAVFLLGAAGGGLVFGWLGDRYGRVRAMVLSILTYSLFTGCSYFAQSPWQLAGFRFLLLPIHRSRPVASYADTTAPWTGWPVDSRVTQARD